MKATYMVEYKTVTGVEDMLAIKANSSGEAFAECIRKNPLCKLIRATREGKYNDGWGKTEFFPPPKYT